MNIILFNVYQSACIPVPTKSILLDIHSYTNQYNHYVIEVSVDYPNEKLDFRNRLHTKMKTTIQRINEKKICIPP